MRLAKLSEFRKRYYTPESAPALRTLRAKITEIPGGTVLAGHYYVDLDEFERVTGEDRKANARQTELEKDSLLEGLIR